MIMVPESLNPLCSLQVADRTPRVSIMQLMGTRVRIGKTTSFAMTYIWCRS